VLPTGQYKGETGIAVVVPDLTAADVKDDGTVYRIDVDEKRLVDVPEFPAGWAKTNSSYVDIPVYQTPPEGGKPFVSMGPDPSQKVSVVVEVPESDIRTSKVQIQMPSM
jgi:hypothetical protein